jgi:HEAT repeat protein
MKRLRFTALVILVVTLNPAKAQYRDEAAIRRKIDDLGTELSHPDLEVRKKAAQQLEWNSKDASSALPRLRQALKDKDPQVRARVARALCAIRPLDSDSLEALLAVMKDKDKEVRIEATTAVGMIGEKMKTISPRVLAREIAPALLEATKDPEPTVRQRAIGMLGNVGSEQPRIVKALIAILKDPKADVGYDQLSMRGTAACALALIGPPAKEAVPIMIRILDENNHEPKELLCPVVGALGRIGAQPDVVMPVLQNLLKDHKRIYLRPIAATALGFFGPKAKAAVPDLLAAIDISGATDRYEAYAMLSNPVYALLEIGTGADKAVPLVMKVMNEPGVDKRIQSHAKSLLDTIRERTPKR